MPLFGVVSRLTHQKGLDILLACAKDLLNQHHCQIAVLGNGEAVYESGYLQLAREYQGRVSVTIGYNEELSHQVMAGSDLFLMPSRFEPCGLNQMYGLRYGTPPIVNNTGGLADSVIDTNEVTLKTATANGFVMEKADASNLTKTIERALAYFEDKKIWKKIQQNGMRKNLDWTESAERYINIYQALIHEK
jgi:starch synthase